jgi:hypothetical protein
MWTVRVDREGSVSGPDIRRNHARNRRISFDCLLVARAFRISRICGFIPHCARRRPHSVGFAFRDRKRRHRIDLVGR